MATHAGSVAASTHPSPHRARVGLALLFFGLCAGPVAWAAQLLINYGLASYSCYPHNVPLSHVPPGWGGIWYGLLAVNFLAIAVALAGAMVSHRNWRVTRGESSGHSGHLLEAGEGRTRFIALAGILTALCFLVATIFDTVALFVVPQCAG